MTAPRSPYEAVLHAARDVANLDSAFDAELLGTALLGSVYAVAEDDRAAAVRVFVGGFLSEAAIRPEAALIRRVFAALVPDAPGAADVNAAQPAGGASTPGGAGATGGTSATGGAEGAAMPSWANLLGRVRLTGCYAYGDIYGDQTSYVATFAYGDAEAGGPEHAMVALIDHNIGIAKDIFVGGPAEVVIGQIRELCAADDETWFDDTVPAERIHDEVTRHLKITDSLGTLPNEGSLATDRALVGARLGLLPPGDAAEPTPLDMAGRASLTADFLASPEAMKAGLDSLTGSERTARDFALRLVLDHAETFPDADPLRWSPVMVELFLLDWVHRRAVLDDTDATMLPRTLRVWIGYAGRRRGARPTATKRTMRAVDEVAEDFAKLYASGEKRGPAARAVAGLMADGIDPADHEAVAAWLAAHPQT